MSPFCVSTDSEQTPFFSIDYDRRLLMSIGQLSMTAKLDRALYHVTGREVYTQWELLAREIDFCENRLTTAYNGNAGIYIYII